MLVNQRTCTSTNTNENSKHTHCRVPNRLAQHDWWAGGSTLLQVGQLYPAQILLYLYLRFNFYCICIWICFLIVFVFYQEQLPFVTNGVKNYSSCQHIFTTSWQIGPKIFNFDFHFLGRIPQRKAFTSIFCRQDIWTRNFLLLLFFSSIFEQWTKYFGRQDIWTRNWGRDRCLWSRTAVNRAEFAGGKMLLLTIVKKALFCFESVVAKSAATSFNW